jgi:hypothetical protein
MNVEDRLRQQWCTPARSTSRWLPLRRGGIVFKITTSSIFEFITWPGPLPTCNGKDTSSSFATRTSAALQRVPRYRSYRPREPVAVSGITDKVHLVDRPSSGTLLDNHGETRSFISYFVPSLLEFLGTVDATRIRTDNDRVVCISQPK